MRLFSKSNLFLAALMAFIGGIFIAPQVTDISSPIQWGIFFLIGLGAVIAVAYKTSGTESKYQSLLLVLVVVLSLGAGAARGSFTASESVRESSSLAGAVGEEVDMQGKITRVERKGNFVDIIVKTAGNGILVRADKSYGGVLPGDEISFKGVLRRPENFSEEFDYVSFLENKGAQYQIFYPGILNIEEGFGFKHGLAKLREKGRQVINDNFLPPESDFLSAVLLGEKRMFDDEFKEFLNRSGTRHLAAISGLHMTLLSFFVMELLIMVGLWRQQAFWVTVAFIFLFIVFVGAPSSALRAGIMASLLLSAREIGRISDAGRAVAVAATLMLLAEPDLLRFDLGFQLSFGAVLGIIFLSPILDSVLGFISRGRIKNTLIMTLAAQLGILPLLLLNFGQVSIIAPLSNLLLIGLMPVLMTGGLVLVFLGLLFPVLARLGSFLFWPLARFFTLIVDFVGSLEFASLDISAGYVFGIIYYTILIGIIFWWRRREFRET